MANPVYGSSSYGYGGGFNSSSIYASRSITEPYVPAEPSFVTSSRYLASDPLSSSSNSYRYSSISDRGPSMLYSQNDTIGSGYSSAARLTGGAALWPGPPGVDVGVSAPSVDSIYAGYKRPSTDALNHQSLLGTHNTTGQSEAWYSTNAIVKHPRFESTSNLPVYPQRPGEKDCAHYMLTRTCKLGDSCTFDHPMWIPEGGIPFWKEIPVAVMSESLPARPDVPDCPNYLKTQKCKFGPRCKFNHPKDAVASLSASETTERSASPERPSERPCVFYMKTGKCKFGSTCKFHHPKDIVIPAENGDGEQILTALKPAVTPFTPALLQNSKGLPIEQLKHMFQVQAKQERFETIIAFTSLKMQEGTPVSTHVLKMKGYVEQLSKLGFPISNELATDIILNSLPKSFSQFVLNYRMNNLEKSISELHHMLKTAEASMTGKGSSVLMIREGRVKKPTHKKDNSVKGKAIAAAFTSKTKGKPKQMSKTVAQKPKVAKEHDCFHCGETGHWKRNCPKYLAEIKAAKASGTEPSGVKE